MQSSSTNVHSCTCLYYYIHVYDNFYNFIISGVPSYHKFYGDKKMSRFSRVENIEEK